MNVPHFPGSPERYHREVYSVAISKDGVILEFYRTRDLRALHANSRHISLGSGTQIPVKIIEELGDGSIEAGLARLANAVADLEYRNVRAGDVDPIYKDVIYPLYGGEDIYHSWVAE